MLQRTKIAPIPVLRARPFPPPTPVSLAPQNARFGGSFSLRNALPSLQGPLLLRRVRWGEREQGGKRNVNQDQSEVGGRGGTKWGREDRKSVYKQNLLEPLSSSRFLSTLQAAKRREEATG